MWNYLCGQEVVECGVEWKVVEYQVDYGCVVFVWVEFVYYCDCVWYCGVEFDVGDEVQDSQVFDCV